MPTIASPIFRETAMPYGTLARCPCAVPMCLVDLGDEVGVPIDGKVWAPAHVLAGAPELRP